MPLDWHLGVVLARPRHPALLATSSPMCQVPPPALTAHGGHSAAAPSSGEQDAPHPAALSHSGGISPQSPSISSQGTWLSAQQRARCLPCRPPAGARRLVYRA